MNILIIHAHPEPRSLTSALKDSAVAKLRAMGHEVVVSDLYAEGWKALVDRGDFPDLDPDARLRPVLASRDAFAEQRQTMDVAREQARLMEADAVLFTFPLWWYGLPAILKGWVERVYAYGFGYGVGEHSERHWGDRFGEGMLAGKRAMLILTAGGWREHYSERGVNGPIDDILFPINHGIFYYPGFDVIPPYVIYRADMLDEAGFALAEAGLSKRLETLFDDTPIAYRPQNRGDYEIPALTLKPGLEGSGRSGFALHIREG